MWAYQKRFSTAAGTSRLHIEFDNSHNNIGIIFSFAAAFYRYYGKLMRTFGRTRHSHRCGGSRLSQREERNSQAVTVPWLLGFNSRQRRTEIHDDNRGNQASVAFSLMSNVVFCYFSRSQRSVYSNHHHVTTTERTKIFCSLF